MKQPGNLFKVPSVLVLCLLVAVAVFLILFMSPPPPSKKGPAVKSRPVQPLDGASPNSPSRPLHPLVPSVQSDTSGSNIQKETLEILQKMFTPEQRAEGNFQKLMEILASDAYVEFLDSVEVVNPENFTAFLVSQGLTDAAKTNNEKIFMNYFRGVYPDRQPSDLDGEMKNRLLEAIKSATPDTIQETMSGFAEHKDVTAWIVGRFLGDSQGFSNWVVETIENAPDVPSDMQYETHFEIPFEMPEDLPVSNRSPAMLETQQRQDDEGVSSPTQLKAVIASPSEYEISQERMSQIRETLLRYGTDEGMLQLAETDPDVAEWLLQRFKSPEELDDWLAGDKPAEDRKQERPRPNTQSSRPPKLKEASK